MSRKQELTGKNEVAKESRLALMKEAKQQKQYWDLLNNAVNYVESGARERR